MCVVHSNIHLSYYRYITCTAGGEQQGAGAGARRAARGDTGLLRGGGRSGHGGAGVEARGAAYRGGGFKRAHANTHAQFARAYIHKIKNLSNFLAYIMSHILCYIFCQILFVNCTSHTSYRAYDARR